jgi:hypothetical protein
MAGKGRPNPGGSKTSRFRIARARRGTEALELRLAGHSYAEIGGRMGVSAPRAFKLVSDELARLNGRRAEAAAEVTRVELERLDRLLAAVWPKAVQGDLPSMDRVLSIMQRRARLLGIDLADRQAAAPAGPVVLNVQEVLVNRESTNGCGNVQGVLEGNGGDHRLPPGPAALPPE